MPADHQSSSTAVHSGGLTQRLRPLARRIMWRVARPYARQRGRQAELESSLARLRSDFEHVSRRQTEQIERLEDVTRELILTAETLRREIRSRRVGGEH
jgi:alanyl-tRNA synthetase